MLRHISSAILPLLLCPPLFGLVEHPINEKKPLNITFSKSSHNRISIENGSVEKIFGDEIYFNINLDQVTGNAFVSLLRPIVEPTTLTIVTSSGLIQDLIVTSEDKTSEHLILKERDEVEELLPISTDFHNPTIEFLNKILEGKIPLGYGQCAIQQDEALLLPHPLQTKAIEAFEGPYQHIVVYKLKNEGKNLIILNADSLKKDPMVWVFLNAHELKPQEAVVCIVAYPKRES